MKKSMALALTLMLIIGLAGGAVAESRLDQILAAGKIVMATSPDFAPSEFIDPTKTGQDMYVGCDVALGKYIAEQLGVELVIEAMDFSAVQGAVSMGKVDMAISGFAYTAERAESMELSTFYDTDPTENQQGLLVRTAEVDQYQSIEDFAGKKVAVQNASLQLQLLETYIPDAQVELVADLKDAVMMLITGKVDAVGFARESGEAYSANYPEVVMCSFYYDHSDTGSVLAVPKGEVELIEAINEILTVVNETGLYAQWKAEATELAESLGIE